MLPRAPNLKGYSEWRILEYLPTYKIWGCQVRTMQNLSKSSHAKRAIHLSSFVVLLHHRSFAPTNCGKTRREKCVLGFVDWSPSGMNCIMAERTLSLDRLSCFHFHSWWSGYARGCYEPEPALPKTKILQQRKSFVLTHVSSSKGRYAFKRTSWRVDSRNHLIVPVPNPE